MFEVPAGGRRFRALELLVKQKRLARTAPIPCVVRTEGLAEEDSLAENVQRAPLHPLDQFRAFLTLREKGKSEEEIAAAFFVSVAVVKQRLRLASVSPKLLDVYAEDGMTLDQLMAFTVNPDHARQEQVWEALQRSYTKEPHQIRRMLTEGAVRASDKRAQFVGVEAYEAAAASSCAICSRATMAAGCRIRPCSTGWSRRSSSAKPKRSAPKAGSGSRSRPTSPMATPTVCAVCAASSARSPSEETAARDALQAEFDRLEETYAEAERDSGGGRPAARRDRDGAGRLRGAARGLRSRPRSPAPAPSSASTAPAALRIERGYVRPEDEPPVVPSDDGTVDGEADETGARHGIRSGRRLRGCSGWGVRAGRAAEEDEGVRPIPDRLMTELTAHRTLALRDALGERSGRRLRRGAARPVPASCSIATRSTPVSRSSRRAPIFGGQAPGLADTRARRRRSTPGMPAWVGAAAQGAGRRCGTCSRRSTTTAVRRCSRIASR